MSNLVTITAKFYDKSGTHFNQLNVQSRYQGSSKANTQQTDSNGFFVFQASPNRRVEILAKPPNQKDYIFFKTIDSSILSSKDNPVKVQLPKTIDEYKQVKQPTPAKGIVSTFFKVVDRNGKVMKNFPVQSRPKGKGNSPDKFTDDQGIVEVKSSPNRDIEVLVLTSNDQFVLKSSVNSASGSSQPILIKLDEPYANFLSRSMIKILDRDGMAYVVEKTNVEMLIVESGKKQLYSISNGKLALESMVGQKLEFTVYKPDGKPLKPQPYMATRIKNSPAELHLDVDVTKGTTAPNDPEINKVINDSEIPKFLAECIPLYDGYMLAESDYEAAAKVLGCEVPAIKAVAQVESPRGAFDNFKKHIVPSILYERHKFRTFTNNKFSKEYPDLSGNRGNYGKYSAQYPKLVRAMELDEIAALKSCSWGKFQIMGFNYKAAGFPDVRTMVKAMFKNEKEQLKAFVNFIKDSETRISAIKNKKWANFALNYNGTSYKDYNYDTKMLDQYNYYKSNPSKLP